MIATKKNKKRVFALLSLLVIILSALLIAVPTTTNASATTLDENEVKEEYGGYNVSTSTVTRYWVDIPMSGLKTKLMTKPLKSQGMGNFRADYKLSAVIRFDNVKYKDKPLIMLGNVTVSLPGEWSWNWNVEFKDNLHISLFKSAYNYLQLYDYSVISVLLYSNNRGIELQDSFKVANVKFDNADYDSSIDDPTSPDFELEGETDTGYKPDNNSKPKTAETSESFNLFKSLADLFGTTKNNVIAVTVLLCCGVGVLIIIGNIKPK